MNDNKLDPKLIGGVIGFLFGMTFTDGFFPILVLTSLGAIVATILMNTSTNQNFSKNDEKLDYIKELLALVSVILTNDKKLLQSELNYVKRFLKHNFSEEEAQDYLLVFREYTKKNLSIEKICVRLNRGLDNPGKRQIMHLLIGAAVADRDLTISELDHLYYIGRQMNISKLTIDSLLSMHSFTYEGNFQRKQQGNQQQSSRSSRRPSYSLKDAYRVLEISENATESEVKKAYRKLVVIYHPDKVSQMGANFQKSAKEKFQKIQDAYEQIKKSKGIK